MVWGRGGAGDARGLFEVRGVLSTVIFIATKCKLHT